MRTELGRSQVEVWRRAGRRVGKAEVEVEVDADMVEEKLEEEAEEEEDSSSLMIKSNNPHLAGGEKSNYCSVQLCDLYTTISLGVWFLKISQYYIINPD